MRSLEERGEGVKQPSKYAILQALELSGPERAVLQAVESRKMALTVARVSKISGRPRTSTVHTLKKLAKWKLVREVRGELRSYWMANRNLN